MTMLRRILPWVSLALCAALVVLMAIDLLFPNLYLFLREIVKFVVLVVCLAAAGTGVLLSARQRQEMRRPRLRQRARRG